MTAGIGKPARGTAGGGAEDSVNINRKGGEVAGLLLLLLDVRCVYAAHVCVKACSWLAGMMVTNK